LTPNKDLGKDNDCRQHGIDRSDAPKAGQSYDDADGYQDVVKAAHEARRFGIRKRRQRSVQFGRRLIDLDAARNQERQ